jgi:hypothetical protein
MRLPDEVSGVERAAAGGTPISLDLASDEFVKPEECRKDLIIERGNISHWSPVVFVRNGFCLVARHAAKRRGLFLIPSNNSGSLPGDLDQEGRRFTRALAEMCVVTLPDGETPSSKSNSLSVAA